MSEHSIVEAKNRLSALIEAATAGEHVIITRHGRPVVELRPVEPTPKGPVSKADMDWLAERAVTLRPGSPSAAEIVMEMRDEDVVDLLLRLDRPE